MAYPLLGDQPLPNTMLIYCDSDLWEYTSMKNLLECYNLHSTTLTCWSYLVCNETILCQPQCFKYSWWRHQMETFSALLAICAGNSPVLGEFPTQRPVTRSFDVFFDLRLNKWFSKQPWGWWFETLSWSLWRQCNVIFIWGRGMTLVGVRRPSMAGWWGIDMWWA